MAGIITARLRLTRSGKGLADCIIDLNVSYRVRPGRASDRRLIDQDDVIEKFSSLDRDELSDLPLPLTALVFQPGKEAIVDESGFPRSADSGDADQRAQGYRHI